MKVVYSPSKDELILEIRPKKGRPTKKLNDFRLWWDNDGNILAIAIAKYTEELEEFRKNLKVIQLGGIARGANITDEDIEAARKVLLRGLEEKW